MSKRKQSEPPPKEPEQTMTFATDTVVGTKKEGIANWFSRYNGVPKLYIKMSEAIPPQVVEVLQKEGWGDATPSERNEKVVSCDLFGVVDYRKIKTGLMKAGYRLAPIKPDSLPSPGIGASLSFGEGIFITGDVIGPIADNLEMQFSCMDLTHESATIVYADLPSITKEKLLECIYQMARTYGWNLTVTGAKDGQLLVLQNMVKKGEMEEESDNVFKTVKMPLFPSSAGSST